jgi:hypothetical protein
MCAAFVDLSMDIAGIYDLDISLENSSNFFAQRFHVVPKLTEKYILGIGLSQMMRWSSTAKPVG